MTKKRILNTMTWLAPGGGVDEQLKITIDSLASDFEIHLLVGNEIHDQFLPRMLGRNFHICPWLVRKPNPIKDFMALIWIYKFLRANHFDVIHTHETKSSFLVRLANFRRTFLIYHIHGVVFNDPRPRLINKIYIVLEELTLSLANRVVVVSDAILQEYKKHSIKLLNATVIHSGIDFSRFTFSLQRKRQVRDELGIAQEDLVVIQVGRLSISKNNQEGIRLFSELLLERQLTPGKIWLLVLGDGELRAGLEQLVSELRITDNVIFLGFQERPERYIQAADINILTSLREGLPRVLVEASALRIPSICFEVEGAEEVLGRSKFGFVIKRFERQEFLAKLKLLSSNHRLRNEIGNLAESHVKSQWNMKLMVEKIRQIYMSS